MVSSGGSAVVLTIFIAIASLFTIRYHFDRRYRKQHAILGMSKVIDPDDEDNFSFTIIAVHGLGANPQYTWTARRQGTDGQERVSWLKDLLPQQFPQARIMVFNHNAEWLYNASTKTSLQPARDLIAEMKRLQSKQQRFILIGHSYGGIIIKQALVLKEATELRRSVQGIIFLGTPHLGSSTSNVAVGLVGLLGWILGSKQVLLKALQWHDAGLGELNNLFIEEYSRENAVQIHCFYETKDTRFGPVGLFSAGMIVDKTSASLAGREESWKRDFIDADHSNMNKFVSQDDLGYTKICRALTAILEYAKFGPGDENKPWMVPRQTNKYFTGREGILQSIEADLTAALKYAQPQEQCRIVISGLGGQGKSEICLQIANRVRHKFWAIFWVDVNDLGLAKDGFLNIAELLGSRAQNLDQARTRLSACQKPWLLVLDNADDPRFDYQRYIPGGQTGAVLMTTRVEACKIYATKKSLHLQLEGLPLSEATELLLKSAQIDTQGKDEYDRDAQTVAELLSEHPLALIQAGFYVKQGHCSLREYPAVYKEQRKRLLGYSPDQAQSRYGDVYATFEVSAQALHGSRSESASNALQLLSVLGMLDQIGLPITFFEAVWKGCHSKKIVQEDDDNDLDHLLPEHVGEIPRFLQPESDVWDAFNLREALKLLEGFGLITLDKQELEEIIHMHPLTHAWARDRVKDEEQQRSWFSSMCMSAACGDDFWLLNHRQSSPHLRGLALQSPNLLPGLHSYRIVARTVFMIARLLTWQRETSAALKLLKSLQDYLNLRPDIVASDYTDIYRLAGWSLRDCGKTAEAIGILKQVVDIVGKSLAEDHPDLVNAQYGLAVSYRENEQVQEAVQLLEHLVDIRKRAPLEDSMDLLNYQHELARAYHANGRLEDAIQLLRHVIAIRKKTTWEGHSEVLSSQHVLARVYHANGQEQEAVELLEHVAGIEADLLAVDHPDRLTSEHHLAVFYWNVGKRDQALTMMKHVVDVRTSSLDKDHSSLKLSKEWLDRMTREKAKG